MKAALLVGALLVGACADNPAPLMAPQDGYPCGTGGVACTNYAGQFSGECCWEGSICGGSNTSCPVGSCCEADTKIASHPRPAIRVAR